eukprot:TRINITY_DN90629_c0_g1_i1.p2 TRINITY_DN90629_c0_g1~~TRINITY_DN90629_c0_g1_i1.p2  ORF type:complete len:139 (-),score=27.57 TRINITY_DN90629_c0_g1_i1:70-462(-)
MPKPAPQLVDGSEDAVPGKEDERPDITDWRQSRSQSRLCRADSSVRVASSQDLDARRLEEHEFIEKNDTAKSKLWYIIDIRWLEEWRNFIVAGAAPPGPIDNSLLLEPATGCPRAGLSAVKDFRAVNAVV